MRILMILLLCLFLTGCGSGQAPETTVETEPTEPEETTVPETQAEDPVEAILRDMTLAERVGQLFLARCDGSVALKDIAEYHLGGFVLFSQDFKGQTPDSVREKLHSYQDAAEIPLLLAVDEEGGTVTRISRFPAFRPAPFPSPREAMDLGGIVGAIVNEGEKCQLLKDLGLNVNLGPVCDIADAPGAFLYHRSLGQDPETTANFVSLTAELMDRENVGSVLKHFPGYGNNADTHVGIARDSRSLAELEERDLLPFAAGIQSGADAVLVSHMIVEALDGERPASLSPAVHQYLRQEMGFGGVILTDDLVMEAITDQYGAGEAAVLAVLAGNDLLCSTDYRVQYEAVLAAVEEDRISWYQLEDAVRRVLRWKMELGLLD